MTKRSHYQSVREVTGIANGIVMSKTRLCGNGCPLDVLIRRTKAPTVFKTVTGKEKNISPTNPFQ
ncbi:hypothetical protein ACFLX7_01995 [Chloroflexota bacterium]